MVTAGSKVVVSDAVVTVNDANSTAITAKELSDIGAATTGTVTVTNAVAISGTESEVTAALVTGSSKVIAAKATATISGNTAITKLNAIAEKTDGVITATLAADSLENLDALNTASTDMITVTVNDADNAAVTAANLQALGLKTAGVVTVDNAVAITGSTSEVTGALFTPGSKVVAAKAKVTITGTPKISQLNTIANVTNGVVTATLAADTLANLGALNTASTDDITVTVNDNAGTAVTAANLSALGNKTVGKVTVSKAVEITGSNTELTAALVTAGSRVFLGGGSDDASVVLNDANGTSISATTLSNIGGQTNGTVTVTNAVAISGTESEVTAALVTSLSKVVAAKATATISGNPSITKLNAIAAETTGVITTTLAAGSLASFGSLATDSTDNIKITVNDADGTAVTATDLSALGGKTAGAVTVSKAVAITGTAAEVTAALVSGGSEVVASKATVTITGNPTVSQLNAIAAKTDGVITATLAPASIDDLKSLTTASTDNITVTINDAKGTGVTATDLSTLGGKTAGTVTVTNDVSITGSTSQLTAALITGNTKVVASKADLTISDALNLSQLKAFNAATDGSITLKDTTGPLTGSAADLIAAFAGDVTTHTGNVTITTGDLTTADITKIKAETTGNINGSAISKITGSANDIVTSVNGFNTKPTSFKAVITDIPTIDKFKSVSDLTTGSVEGSIKDSATALASTLKNLNPSQTDSLLGQATNIQLTGYSGTQDLTDLKDITSGTNFELLIDSSLNISNAQAAQLNKINKIIITGDNVNIGMSGDSFDPSKASSHFGALTEIEATGSNAAVNVSDNPGNVGSKIDLKGITSVSGLSSFDVKGDAGSNIIQLSSALTHSGIASVDLGSKDGVKDELILNSDISKFVNSGSLGYTTVTNFDVVKDDVGVFYGSENAISNGIYSTRYSNSFAINQDLLMIEEERVETLSTNTSNAYNTADKVKSKIAGVISGLSGTADRVLMVEHAYNENTELAEGYLFAASVKGISTSDLKASDSIEVASIARLVDTNIGDLSVRNMVNTKNSDLS
ncbi:hypothetical protein [Synechococcus sp. MVIR-18-1]|uniref:beta strand repeat-containing protein n=1 Tax=Synechococcus sp. MVIR-18-1 TaxID=1386941 RepID=UPI001644D35F|nr:hypothetical protein [Synechococcus sp. MVIR-18-1]QNI75799.1 hypothetical protein SynMVIR181_00811 [Synechococcus sp. MVIR-18-1]